ncbi:hypothetical protein KGQ20_13850 [Catenulispora sp. NF23]|uniref:hypothetical protein n=1 Tax=Catenulispora pinistramenti TaxID=2705254 RepID=UPI001BADCE61|nr:hypothetical protein [Catenulispora pinistramenti]MBS2533852.1 hypothetical protein [Catenulispora pinistramenti]
MTQQTDAIETLSVALHAALEVHDELCGECGADDLRRCGIGERLEEMALVHLPMIESRLRGPIIVECEDAEAVMRLLGWVDMQRTYDCEAIPDSMCWGLYPLDETVSEDGLRHELRALPGVTTHGFDLDRIIRCGHATYGPENLAPVTRLHAVR